MLTVCPLRISYASDNRALYPFTFHAVIDFLTIVPVFVELTTPANTVPELAFLRFVRVLRVMRILRAFKVINASMSGAWSARVVVRLCCCVCLCRCLTFEDSLRSCKPTNVPAGVDCDKHRFSVCWFGSCRRVRDVRVSFSRGVLMLLRPHHCAFGRSEINEDLTFGDAVCTWWRLTACALFPHRNLA